MKKTAKPKQYVRSKKHTTKSSENLFIPSVNKGTGHKLIAKPTRRISIFALVDELEQQIFPKKKLTNSTLTTWE